MVYNFNGSAIKISDAEIEKNMKNLDLSKEEAVQMWLEDNGYLDNEEQNLLDNSAKQVKISRDAIDVGKERKSSKPRTIKVSDEKKELFNVVLGSLNSFYANNVTILKENKSFEIKIGEKSFCVDIIEHKNKKK